MTEADPKIIAVLDACVLYPPSLRDLLMRVAVAGAYEPRWTEEIHTEWTRNVLADRPDVTPSILFGSAFLLKNGKISSSNLACRLHNRYLLVGQAIQNGLSIDVGRSRWSSQ